MEHMDIEHMTLDNASEQESFPRTRARHSRFPRIEVLIAMASELTIDLHMNKRAKMMTAIGR